MFATTMRRSLCTFVKKTIFGLGGLACCMGAVWCTAVTAEDKWEIGDKTLVAWAAPANLTQRGGSVLTIEKSGGVFDAIVFGEIEPGKWMAGSEGFKRTSTEQADFPLEAADNQALVMVAIVYRGNEISIYRNGEFCTQYTAAGAERFGSGDSLMLIGLRHLGAARDNCAFTGSIDDARLYDRALTAEQIAALRPNTPSDPPPFAWWNFEDGRARDQMGTFPTTSLVGEARVADGRLHLDSGIAYLMATRKRTRSRRRLPAASTRSFERIVRNC